MIKVNLSERRNFVRAKRVLSIEYHVVHSSRKPVDKTWHLSTTEDMSLGGVSFYSDQEIRHKDVLEIRVVMSGVLDIFKGLAKVVRVERKRSGQYSFVAVQIIGEKGKRRQAKSYLSPSRIS